jgi:hypothetical protein
MSQMRSAFPAQTRFTNDSLPTMSGSYATRTRLLLIPLPRKLPRCVPRSGLSGRKMSDSVAYVWTSGLLLLRFLSAGLHYAYLTLDPVT